MKHFRMYYQTLSAWLQLSTHYPREPTSLGVVSENGMPLFTLASLSCIALTPYPSMKRAINKNEL